MTQYHSPYSSSRRWLRGNLHLHTCCGPYVDLAQTGPRYGRLGYHFLAVSDHDRSAEPSLWQRWCAATDLLLIPGVERSVPQHILDIGTQSVREVATDDYARSASMLRDGGGFIVGCHPQEYANGADLVRRGAAFLHGLEIYNALRAKRGCAETANVALWDELLSAGHRIWAVASDDFHDQYLDPGHGWICVQAPEDSSPVTWPDLVAWLKAGAFYASTGPAFEQFACYDGRLRVRAGAGTECLRVIGPGGVLLCEQAGGELAWLMPPNLRYVRVEAVQGPARAWSQPFFAQDHEYPA